MLEGEINSFKSIRVSKRRKNMPSYWLIPTKGFLSSLAYTRISSSMGRLMTVPDMRVAPLLPALGRGLTMTGQDSQYLLSFKAVRWKWHCDIGRSHYRNRWHKNLTYIIGSNRRSANRANAHLYYSLQAVQ